MATISPSISPTEIERRRRGLGSVIGTMAAEGEAIPSDAMVVFEQWIRGEITSEEKSTAIRAMLS